VKPDEHDRCVDDALKAADTSIRELMKLDDADRRGLPPPALGWCASRDIETRSALRDIHTAVRYLSDQVRVARGPLMVPEGAKVEHVLLGGTSAGPALMLDAERIHWLGADPDRLEDVRGRMLNEGEDLRAAVDFLMMPAAHQRRGLNAAGETETNAELVERERSSR